VTAELSGLSPNTTYHFQIVATNAGGTTSGTDGSFNTLPNAPAVVTGSPSSLSQTAATLNATVNPNGGTVTSCQFQWGTTASYGQTASCIQTVGGGTSAVAVTAPLTGLSPNTTYHYRIVATNAGGTNNGSDGTLTTLPNPPTVATGSPSSVSQTAATLNANVNPNGGTVTSCQFQWGTTSSYGQTASCAQTVGSGTSAVAVSAALTGLTANTIYHYRIVATNAGGTSDGADQTFTSSVNAPSVTTGVASSISQTAATLNATVNPSAGNITNCQFNWGTTISYGQTAPCAQTVGSGTSAVAVTSLLSGLSPNTTYHFQIVATNASGTTSGTDGTLTTLPNGPTVVTGATSGVTQTAATLTATVNPNGATVSTCQFQYGTTSSYGQTAQCAQIVGAGTSAAAVTTALSGLAPNTTYHYRIVATNPGGTNNGSDGSFSTPPDPPTAVTGTGSSVSPSAATLNATVNPNGGNVTSCQFEWGTTTAYGQTAPCGQTVGNGTVDVPVSSALSGLAPGTLYHFRIDAGNTGGTTDGADDTFTTLPSSLGGGSAGPVIATSPPVVHGSSAADFAGTVNPNGLPTTAHYEFALDPKYYGGGPLVYSQTTPTETIGSDSTAHSLLAVASGLVPNALYHVRLVATNSAGTTEGPDQTFTTGKEPSPPPPVLGQSADLTPVSGLVLIKLPHGGSGSAIAHAIGSTVPTKGEGFIPLTQARQLPVGTQVYALRGTLELAVASTKRHHSQKAKLTGGIYTIGQAKSGPQKGLTTFTLKESAFPGAPSYASCTAKRPAIAAALPLSRKPKLSKQILQSLSASDNHGSFRTTGRYSAATVRGTNWTVQDRCDGTLTTVHRGTVNVLDFTTRKTVVVHAGHSFLAAR